MSDVDSGKSKVASAAIREFATFLRDWQTPSSSAKIIDWLVLAYRSTIIVMNQIPSIVNVESVFYAWTGEDEVATVMVDC